MKFLKPSSGSTHQPEADDPRFVELTPTGNAESIEVYSDALSYALRNDSIKNIAITGPFGSGKTSIIKTFKKKSSLKFLDISLASFKEDSFDDDPDDRNKTIMIERSILQQMLYGADADDLPYSRFKRITTPNQPQLKAALIVSWIILAICLYLNRAEITIIKAYNEFYTLSILVSSFLLGIPVVLTSDIYKSLFRMPFKKISLKNAEIETADVPETSILNRHLDEILYFFQSTKYDVVAIEDLDRFGSPEIFVKLREINKLINDNKKINSKITFLYALKDDMFTHKDRAKFFDFIIPVVPIINSTNSLDKMLQRLKHIQGAESIDQQFLREVSLYIDDLRLMHNIFNEFNVYKIKLSSDSLNMTKLLAMMIYKNAYPGDFEKLHHGSGALYEVTTMRAKLISSTKQNLTNKILDVRNMITDSEKEEIGCIDDLINTFIGYIVSTSNHNNICGLYIKNSVTLFSNMRSWEVFEQVMAESILHIAIPHQYGIQNGTQKVSTGKSFSQIEKEMSPSRSFEQRKIDIENKSATRRVELQSMIHKMENERSLVSQVALHQLLQKNGVVVEDIIKNNDIDDTRLLAYLINNGHLDENYHLYVSNFHEGRLSKNDRDFLLAIRDFISPDPKHRIDNADEVLKNMRPEDFNNKYVLNVDIVDFLLSKKAEYQDELNSMINYLSCNFIDSEEFHIAYWDVGKNLGDLVNTVSKKWPNYGVEASKFPQGAEHIALILTYVPPNYIAEKMNNQGIMAKYISENCHLIFASDVSQPSDLSALSAIHVKVKNLSSIMQNIPLMDYIHINNLYEINATNIAAILDVYVAKADRNLINSNEANFSSICTYGTPELKDHINKHLNEYVDTVLLSLPDNIKERYDVVLELLRSESLTVDQKTKIILKQEVIFEQLQDLPLDQWSVVLENNKIRINWANIFCYLNNETTSKEMLTEVLNKADITNILSQQIIDIQKFGSEESKLLSRFIFNNDSLSDTNYSKYITCLPYRYKNFPEKVSTSKMEILAKAGIIILNEDSFDLVKDHQDLLSSLLLANITDYLNEKEKYPITDSVREILLLSDRLNTKDKVQISKDVTPSGAKASRRLSRCIADIIKQPGVDSTLFDSEVISSAILNAQNVEDSVRILTKSLPTWDGQATMNVLGQLAPPYNEITDYGKRPKLPNTPTNLLFAKQLETHNLVSSIKVDDSTIRINTFKPS